ncbi:MAG: hypothetical protein KY475_13525 [Planctomycetes bacterium]|nr:hypothetical protein [Planctomycetota bacterium]
MKDIPAQFHLRGLLWFTAAIALLCGVARVVDGVGLLVVALALMTAPLLIAGSANYLLFFMRFERRMAVADVLMLLLLALTSVAGLAVGCFGVLVAAIFIIGWLPQLFLYWDWKDRKRSEYGRDWGRGAVVSDGTHPGD